MSIISEDYGGMLRAIADNKELQFKGPVSPGGSNDWQSATHEQFLNWVSSKSLRGNGVHWRILPETICINGLDVPKPVTNGDFTVEVQVLNRGWPSSYKSTFKHSEMISAVQHYNALVSASGETP